MIDETEDDSLMIRELGTVSGHTRSLVGGALEGGAWPGREDMHR